MSRCPDSPTHALLSVAILEGVVPRSWPIPNSLDTTQYGGCPGDATGFSLRYQGERLGIWDPQNRDLHRKSPPKPKNIGWLIITC